MDYLNIDMLLISLSLPFSLSLHHSITSYYFFFCFTFFFLLQSQVMSCFTITIKYFITYTVVKPGCITNLYIIQAKSPQFPRTLFSTQIFSTMLWSEWFQNLHGFRTHLVSFLGFVGLFQRSWLSYLPTPLLGQDMTQGLFLNRV